MPAISQTNLEPPTAVLEDSPTVTPPDLPEAKTAERARPDLPTRPAWAEIDLAKLKRNFELILQSRPAGVQLAAVVKDEGYGHGALAVAKTALTCGASFLVLSTLEEAVALRERGIRARMLLLGDRHEADLPWCITHDLTCCVSEPRSATHLARLAARAGKRVPVHLKLNTGMNRYGVRWNEAGPLAELICSNPSLVLEGVLTHFAQSDEADKTFALLQLARFNTAVVDLAARGIRVKLRHVCNSGGFLDLPQAHFEMVRLGILPLGVYPSAVCRRLEGTEPVMSVKARIAAIQQLQPGDSVGYGMRYTAPSPRRVAVLPLGYGDGFPRVRNQGCALLHGQRAPIIGGVAMDAFMVDITDIPGAQLWDEAVLMGRQGGEEISVHEVARLKGSVSYDVLTGWRARLPRVYRA
jgi:alanine racemase